MEKVFVLFHDDLDGIMSMYAAWLKFGSENVEYIKVQYGKPFPISDDQLNKDVSIYILDFSYQKQFMIELNDKVKRLLVIDHHKGAEKEIAGLPFVEFDKSKSGAMITWEYFHHLNVPPPVIRMAQDYDLYKFELPFTRAFNYGLLSSPKRYDPEWLNLVADARIDSGSGPYTNILMSKEFMEVYDIGQAIVNNQEAIAKEFAEEGEKYRIVNYNGHKVAVYNTTTMINRLAEEIYNTQDVDYTLSYFITKDPQVVFNWRSSKKSGIDVSEFARSFGGNGHSNAAGAPLSLEDGFKFLIELYHE